MKILCQMMIHSMCRYIWNRANTSYSYPILSNRNWWIIQVSGASPPFLIQQTAVYFGGGGQSAATSSHFSFTSTKIFSLTFFVPLKGDSSSLSPQTNSFSISLSACAKWKKAAAAWGGPSQCRSEGESIPGEEWRGWRNAPSSRNIRVRPFLLAEIHPAHSDPTMARWWMPY